MSLREIEFRITEDGDCFVTTETGSQYRNGQTVKRACIMTPNGPIYLEPTHEADGWHFKVSYPDKLQMQHNEFDYSDEPIQFPDYEWR